MEVRCYRVAAGEDPRAIRDSIARKSPGLLVQTVKSSAVGNSRLVEMLVEQTQAATASGNLLARKRDVDLLLRLAGTTQISAALNSVGASRGAPFVVILAGDEGEIEASEKSFLRGADRVKGRELHPSEFGRVERAALLNAARA